MNNHFHIVVETPRGNVLDGMRWLLGVSTTSAKISVSRRKAKTGTTMTLDWIAEHLSMGSAGHVSHLFYRNKSDREKAEREESQKKLFSPHF
jgi:hypothetical protein